MGDYKLDVEQITIISKFTPIDEMNSFLVSNDVVFTLING